MNAASRIAFQLEEMGRNSQLEGASDTMGMLTREVVNLKEFIAGYKQGLAED